MKTTVEEITEKAAMTTNPLIQAALVRVKLALHGVITDQQVEIVEREMIRLLCDNVTASLRAAIKEIQP